MSDTAKTDQDPAPPFWLTSLHSRQKTFAKGTAVKDPIRAGKIPGTTAELPILPLFEQSEHAAAGEGGGEGGGRLPLVHACPLAVDQGRAMLRGENRKLVRYGLSFTNSSFVAQAMAEQSVCLSLARRGGHDKFFGFAVRGSLPIKLCFDGLGETESLATVANGH